MGFHSFWWTLIATACPPAQVHRVEFYMHHYGAATPKRLYVIGNSRHVGGLNKGKLKGWAKTKKDLQTKGMSKDLVIKYQDSKGRQRWKGSHDMKASELGSYLFQKHVVLCLQLNAMKHTKGPFNIWEPKINLLNGSIGVAYTRNGKQCMKPKFEFVSWLSRGLVVLFPGAIHHVLDLKWYLYFMTWSQTSMECLNYQQ